MGNAKDVVWHIMRAGQQYGPFSADEFERFERERQLVPTDFIWHTGLTDWIQYQEFDNDRTKIALPTLSPLGLLGSKAGALYILIKSAGRFPIFLITTTFNLVTRPSSFGRQRIDRKPGDLQRAIAFFLNMIGIEFLIFATFSHLYGYSGMSEVRGLVILTIQFAVGCPLLYLLNLAARQAVNFIGIVQAVLYFDALLQMFSLLSGALIGYLATPPEMGRGELDIIATEYEKCLAGQSLLYWLMRGDLQFFLDPIVTPATKYIEFVQTYGEYVVAGLLCIIFGKLMEGRYAASALLNMAFGIGTFIVVATGWQLIQSKVQNAVALSSTCSDTFFKIVAEKYSVKLLGRQIAYRVNQQIATNMRIYQPSVTFAGEKLVMGLVLRPSQIETGEEKDAFRRGGLAFYCENNTDFMYARDLHIPLHLIVGKQDGSIIIDEELTPAHCRK